MNSFVNYLHKLQHKAIDNDNCIVFDKVIAKIEMGLRGEGQ